MGNVDGIVTTIGVTFKRVAAASKPMAVRALSLEAAKQTSLRAAALYLHRASREIYWKTGTSGAG